MADYDQVEVSHRRFAVMDGVGAAVGEVGPRPVALGVAPPLAGLGAHFGRHRMRIKIFEVVRTALLRVSGVRLLPAQPPVPRGVAHRAGCFRFALRLFQNPLEAFVLGRGDFLPRGLVFAAVVQVVLVLVFVARRQQQLQSEG